MKRGCPSHPKTHELAALLGIRHVAVIGHLELLFHFTAQYAPQGDIGRYSDKRIAAGLEWASKPEKLIDSLVAAGWLDRDDRVRLVVHDWSDHADRTTLQRLARGGKSTVQPYHTDANKACTQSETNNRTPPSLSQSHKPEPEPGPRKAQILPDESPVRNARPNPKTESLEWFKAEFWVKGVVWKKIGYGSARESWLRKVTSRAIADEVIAAAREQGPGVLQDAAVNGHSVLHPSTWLNQERWKDEPQLPGLVVAPRFGPGPSRSDLALERLREDIEEEQAHA